MLKKDNGQMKQVNKNTRSCVSVLDKGSLSPFSSTRAGVCLQKVGYERGKRRKMD